MNILRIEMWNPNDGVIAIEDLTTNDLWDDPKYKAKSKVT